MKRYLRRLFIGGAVIIMILNMLICSAVFVGILRGNARASLKTAISAFAMLPTPAVEDCPSLAERIAGAEGNLEAAFLTEDGIVVASAPGSSELGTHHLTDEDVRQALRGEWGESVRQSADTGIHTVYMTRRIGDGLMLRLGYPLTAVQTFLLILLAAGIGLCAALLVALHFLTGRLTSRLLRPLEQINDLLHASRTPQTAIRPEDTFEEAQPLMDNISAMIRKLHYDFEEIQRTQQMRRDFVANASHELKSPLTSIRGFAELIQSGMVSSDEQQKQYLARIISESNRLLAIIEDILHLSKAESGAPENVTTVDMRQVCDEAVQALESIASKKRIRLDVAGHGLVRANAQEMWELVYNLVDNGIRYGREDGFVNVRVDHHGLTVIDNGIGMEQSQLPRIFERFYRVDNSHSKSTAENTPGGTGLGLSIVKHIALKYGGDVSVVSAPGEGTTFTVRFAEETEVFPIVDPG